MNQHHTFDIELNKKFTILKDYWDPLTMQRLAESCDISKSADVAAVVFQEGLASVCLITTSMTITRAKIEQAIARKRHVEAHKTSMEKFFAKIYLAIKSAVDPTKIQVLLLASPGSLNENLLKFVREKSLKEPNRDFEKLFRENTILVHTSDGHKRSLNEALNDPTVLARMSGTKQAEDISLFASFRAALGRDNGYAWYGPSYVKRAVDFGAVQTLLLCDGLLKSASPHERKVYSEMSDAVKAQGGTVRVLSAAHPVGEEILAMGGVVALLRYPLQLDDEEEDQDELDGDETPGL